MLCAGAQSTLFLSLSIWLWTEESVVLDLSKAYDKVSHQGLLSKLSTCGFTLVTRDSNGCPTSFLTANSVFVFVTALNLPGWHRGREYLRKQFWGRCYFSFTSMIFLLNLRVVVLFLLMTPRYMQPVLTPNSVVQESQPIWMLLQN